MSSVNVPQKTVQHVKRKLQFVPVHRYLTILSKSYSNIIRSKHPTLVFCLTGQLMYLVSTNLNKICCFYNMLQVFKQLVSHAFLFFLLDLFFPSLEICMILCTFKLLNVQGFKVSLVAVYCIISNGSFVLFLWATMCILRACICVLLFHNKCEIG